MLTSALQIHWKEFTTAIIGIIIGFSVTLGRAVFEVGIESFNFLDDASVFAQTVAPSIAPEMTDTSGQLIASWTPIYLLLSLSILITLYAVFEEWGLWCGSIAGASFSLTWGTTIIGISALAVSNIGSVFVIYGLSTIVGLVLTLAVFPIVRQEIMEQIHSNSQYSR